MQVKIRKISKEFSQLPSDSSSRSEQGREDSLHHGLGRGSPGRGWSLASGWNLQVTDCGDDVAEPSGAELASPFPITTSPFLRTGSRHQALSRVEKSPSPPLMTE